MLLTTSFEWAGESVDEGVVRAVTTEMIGEQSCQVVGLIDWMPHAVDTWLQNLE